jgi:predicted phosphodiesterase
MMQSPPWSESEIDAAIHALRASRTPAEALPTIAQAVGHAVTVDALRNVLRRRGMGAPTSYCNGKAPKASAPEPPRPKPLTKVAFIPDSHWPFADVRAWALMLKAMRGWKPDIVVVLGDLADFYSVSFHPKDPKRKVNLEHEIESVSGALRDLESLGAGRQVYCSGNHEARLDRYLTQNAPAVFAMLRLPEILRLDARGWEWVPYMQSIKIGSAHVTHDFGDCGINAHRTARATVNASAVIGHVHRMAMQWHTLADGTPTVGAAFGHLLDVASCDYMHRAKTAHWQLGFGTGHITPDGKTHLHPVPIDDYKCIVDGVLYEGLPESGPRPHVGRTVPSSTETPRRRVCAED